MRRKFFSIITALALCLSIFPAAALAVEGGAQLTEGGTYYFDLSGAGIPGNKVNSSLPGGSLSWVPFTYVGEVNAYVLKESSANNREAIAEAAAATDPTAQYGYTYPHSLFIADRYVKSGLTWSNTDLNPGSVIFGKTYASGGVSYTLRAPSTGMGTGSGACEPGNNEWDVILNQSEDYIKNWSEAGFWGQEVYKEIGGIISVLGCHVRGKNSIRGSSLMAIPNTTDAAGFRPVLELPAGLTAGDLSVVTVDLNGGSLDAKASVDLAVKSGSGFTAPGSTGVVAPEIPGETMTFEGWTDGENTYQPGDAIPAGVTKLTAKWSMAPRCSIAADQTSLNFGSVYPDYSAPDMRKTVTVTNTGNQPVTLELSAAQTFTVSGLSKTELAPNETASFTVQPPAGLEAGSYSDTVTVKGASGGQRTNEVTITASFTVRAYSSASALNTGGTYYFDLSGAGIPGSRNWVAFTYAGQISAYSGTNYSSYDHCLFIAENSVVNETWDNLNDSSLINGKAYSSGGVSYTLRAPSGGTGPAAVGGGTPTNNEWDVIRGKNFIKNDSFRSLAQDRIKEADIEKTASVVRQGENFELVTPTYPFSFRPVLELPRDLPDSGLRSPALYLNGGSLDGREKADIVVKSGEAFPAPGAEGLTAPSGKELSGWRGSDGVTYNAGDSVPETVEYLVAQWRSVYYTVTVQAGENGSVSGGGSFEANTSVTVTAAPDEGCQFLHWEEDGKTVSTEESYTFRVTGNRTLTAVFEHVHEWGNWTPDGDGVHHSRVCEKDKNHRETEDCTYGEYTHNDTSHTRICKLCGYQNVEAHNIKCTAEASGTVIAVSEACKTCGYGKDLGTVTIHIPKLVYGDLTGVVTAENTLTEPVAVAGNVKNPGGETVIFSDHATIAPPTMATLTGNALLSAGEHKIKINIVIIRDENALAECELTFNVAPAPLTVDMVTLSAENATYSGTAQKPALSVQLGETTLTEGTDYTVAYSNNVNVGTATVTVTGKGNYTGKIEKTFQIKPATLTVTPPTAALSYGQKLSDSTLTGGGATAPGVGNVAGNWEWVNQEEQPKATGDFSATFKPTDTKNYETPESVIVNVTVNPAEPKITLTVPAHQVAGGEVTVTCKVENPYDASWKDDLPAVTLSCPGFAIENGKFTIPSETTVGTVITITANTAAVDGKYTAATKTATVTVTDKIPVTIHAEAVSRAYNGQPFTISTPVVRGQDGQTVADAAVAYTWSTDEAPVNAGDYTVTIDLTEAAKKTYAAQPLELSFSITKASATVTANSQTITKGDPAPAYTCTVSPTGADLGFTPTLSCAYTTESGAGEYPITVDGDKVSTDGNYTITYVNGKLTVKEPSSSGGGGGGDTPVNVTGVSLDRNSLTLTIGESFSLTVTITPSNADNKSVTWASSNRDVASVSGGTVTAVGPGTTTITVTTRSGGHTASCTVTVKAKVYTITYDPNGGTGTMRTGSAADGEPFTLPGCTFTPPEGKVFDAWAIGSADGTQAKAGSSHTFTEDTTVYAVWKDAPLVTYAVTYNANGGTGTMTDGIAPDQEAFVLPECGFTAPEGKEFDCWAIGSATGPKVQPGGGYTFTANTTVYALWKDLPPVPYDITGIVWQNGEAVPGATVQLKRGADVVAAQTTGADGGFTFSGVPAGVYNLVAIKDGITVTVMQEITSGSVNLTITLPNGKTNTVVEIKGQEGTPPVVVGEMEKLFTDDTVYTAEDKEIVATGGTVEFKMVVGKQDASSSAAIQIEASKPAGQTIGLFLDLSIIKTVTPKDGQAETTSVTQVGSLIETLIPLPDEMQGKASYTVYREHDGIVEALPNSGNGERYTVSSDKKSITIYARKYSTYAVAWSDNGGDTPVDPGKPSRPSGGGGSSVSTYAVTVSKTTYGKVVSSRTNASSGSTVTLTVTPDSGYTLDTLAVTDSRGNAVKLTDKGDGKYTFTMPSRAVTVTASFAPIVWNNPYTDVATGTWYYEAVRFVSENGLMGGYGKGLFGPNDNLSRAQLVQILYNHAGRPVIQNGSAFTDAAPGAWYADAVAWAAAEGIISGYGGGRFGPNDPITREQLAVILWRYAGFPVPPNLLLDFPDANTASGYALDALRWAVEQGIISGYSNGRLEPKTPATRGQVAQILRNFLQKQ